MTGKLEYAFTVRTIELEKGLANSAESEITLKLGSELAQLAETLSNGLEDMHCLLYTSPSPRDRG